MIGYGRILTGLVVVAAASAACAHRAAPPELRPALTGRWVLAKAGAQTDTTLPTTAVADRRAPEGERRGGRGGYGGERGEGGSGGYSRSVFDPAILRAAMEAVIRGDSTVSIAQDSLLHFAFADGSYFDVRPDGHLQDDIWRGVGRIRSGAYWGEAGLVLERKLEETGVTVTQTFARPAGGGRLTVTTSVKGSGAPRPLTMKREYTLAGGVSAAPAP